MGNTEVINMAGVADKWLNLMLHVVNSTDTVFRIQFSDKKEAGNKRSHIHKTVQENRFNMLVVRRGSDVYVVKLGGAKKVRIIDGK